MYRLRQSRWFSTLPLLVSIVAHGALAVLITSDGSKAQARELPAELFEPPVVAEIEPVTKPEPIESANPPPVAAPPIVARPLLASAQVKPRPAAPGSDADRPVASVGPEPEASPDGSGDVVPTASPSPRLTAVQPRRAVVSQAVAIAGVDKQALAKGWQARVSKLLAERALHNYPRRSLRRGNQGVVVLSMLVDVGGHVRRVSLRRSSGHVELDEAALTAVRGVGALPPPPAGLDREHRPLTVPIAYRIQ